MTKQHNESAVRQTNIGTRCVSLLKVLWMVLIV